MVELMVVVIIIGILAAMGIPQYLKSVEMSKADSGSSLMKMVGAANRMYSIDHAGAYVSGPLTTGCDPNGACPGGGTGCDLVACKYLPSNSYGTSPSFSDVSWAVAAAGNAAGGGGACPLAVPGGSVPGGGNLVACAMRGSGASGTYAAWGYAMDVNGVITSFNGAPTPSQ
jgi:type II secretory pathway pseudopilin PulG